MSEGFRLWLDDKIAETWQDSVTANTQGRAISVLEFRAAWNALTHVRAVFEKMLKDQRAAQSDNSPQP